MGKLQIMLLLLIAAFSGCSESDEREYMGKNSIYIRTEGDPVILAMDNEPLKATLMLIRAYDKDVSLEIDVKYLTEGVENLVTVNPAVVTIPAGEKSVDFEIISNDKEGVEDKVYLEIGVNIIAGSGYGESGGGVACCRETLYGDRGFNRGTTGFAGRVQGERVGFE
ncbi:MAG: DUF4929 family protein [Butyricimonas paravirosa]